jgi:flagellar basal-body rod modification protein FlgD
MDVTTVTTAPTTTATPAKPKASDYETFLRMMTVQIKNQDPLSPMSADDFAVQLATFSGVEQQARTNALLEQQISQNDRNSLASMVGWVGKEARIEAPVHFDGTSPVTLSPNPALGADKAVLVVKDDEGVEVSRIDIAVSSVDYDWLGLDSAGNPLPAGIYELTLESYLGATKLGTTGVEYFGQIEEIRSSVGGVTALFQGGVEVSTGLITALREPTV